MTYQTLRLGAVATLASVALLVACGSADTSPELVTSATSKAAFSLTDWSIVATPYRPRIPYLTCKAEPLTNTGYSLVFKSCNGKVAEYYDKTECVRDNVTGLIWQGHAPWGTGLRASDQYKTNFDNANEPQVNNGGNFSAPTQATIDAVSNAIGFKNAVNGTKLCGSNQWRLPTNAELIGLVNDNDYPRINNEWFPYTMGGHYWTSSPYMYPGNPVSNAAWAYAVSFRRDNAGYALMRDTSYQLTDTSYFTVSVRLVHD